jgi:aldehyde dehydrogenase (NAD+)
MEDETFGPILAVTAVENVQEAIREINSRPKPLALYIYTNDDEVAQTVIHNTSSGGITVNSVIFHVGHSGLPFGGVGNSGMGVYHGERTGMGVGRGGQLRCSVKDETRPNPDPASRRQVRL